MKTSRLAIALVAAALLARADIVSVDVPVEMLHAPGTGHGYLGKVSYSLAAGANDSVNVSLEIVPVGGGTALQLSEVSGDVGLIRVIDTTGVNDPKEIFFSYTGSPSGRYVARVTAVALISQVKQSVESKLASMSFNDKATILGGNGGYESKSAGGIPPLYTADGPNGVRWYDATLFPHLGARACTFDTSLAHLAGTAIGREFRARERTCAFAPAMNIVYHPQQGRAGEYYSEDPFLTGKMAAADVRGLQSADVIACVKHFACNQNEDHRMDGNSVVDERSLNEIYLRAFSYPITEANPLGMMSAYNRINGTWAESNKYTLTDVLRTQWGFRGIVITDWDAGSDAFATTARYGCDVKMPNANDYVPSSFQSLGADANAVVDMHARRVIYAQKMIGALEPGYVRKAYSNLLLSDEHRAVSRRVGSAGIVLARNEGNLLPLPKTGAKIALTGAYADSCRPVGLQSSADVFPVVKIAPRRGVTELLAGVGAGASTLVTNINDADYVVVFVGVTGEGEGHDRPSLTITSGAADVQAALAAKPQRTIVVFTGGSAAIAGPWSTAPAVMIAFYPGQEQGHIIADALFGNTNCSGKLGVTFPKDASQLPNWTLTAANALKYPRADSAHGYFRVNKMGVEPLFNFGHGLSYTTFAYSNLRIYPAAISAGDRIIVKVDVANTGSVAGQEAAQLYLSLPADKGVPVRVQELRGFSKLTLAPGESKTATFVMTGKDMAYYDNGGTDFSGTGAWKVLSGTYGVRVGTSSERTRQPSLGGAFVVQ